MAFVTPRIVAPALGSPTNPANPAERRRRSPSCARSTVMQLNGSGSRYMSMTVWEWFEQRSYHHRDFESLARTSGDGVERPSTTLIFPARNVAGTIGTILTVVDGLRARTGLPGQVIVIDADSPDGTADVARA